MLQNCTYKQFIYQIHIRIFYISGNQIKFTKHAAKLHNLGTNE